MFLTFSWTKLYTEFEVLTVVVMRYNTLYSVESQPAFTLECYSAYWTLKIEAIYSSEKSVDFQRTTRRHIPEASPLQHNCRLIFSFPNCWSFVPFIRIYWTSLFYDLVCILVTRYEKHTCLTFCVLASMPTIMWNRASVFLFMTYVFDR
jgi:hypothetical protein